MSLDEKPSEISKAIEENKAPEAEKSGRVGQFLKNTGSAVGNVVGQSGAMVGNMAGKVVEQALPTLGNVVDKTSRLTMLNKLIGVLPNPFAAKLRSGEIPPRSATELAQAFADWLRQKNKNGVEILSSENDQIIIKFKDAGLLGGRYLFAVAPSADETLTQRLFAPELKGHQYSGVAILAVEWPPTRADLEKDLSMFVWSDGVRLGKDGVAADYLADWLADYTGYQFEKKDLIGNLPTKSRKVSYIRTFIGRDEDVTAIGRSITTSWKFEDGLPWIFSIWGAGGSGKSYLLQRVQQLYGHRMLYAQVDHQNPEETEESLMRLLNGLAVRLREGGCATPRFEKTHRELVAAKNRAAGIAEQSMVKDAGNVASKGFSIASKLAGKAERMVKMFDIAGAITDVGLGIFDRISKQQQEKNDAVLTSRPIQDLTAALVQDLENFIEKQSKEYYLWRRPVFAFDTYELIGPLADQWLRTIFLPAIHPLQPVILIAGRYELLRFNTRWAEYQDGMRVIKLDSFSPTEAGRYLETLGKQDPTRASSLYELTGGLPLFISSVANLSSEEAAIKALTGRIFEEIEPEWHHTFLDMAVPDGFNLDTVQKVLGEEGDTQAAFDRLTEATFVEGRGGMWHFLPAVRHVLLRYGELESPTRMASVREKLS